MAIIGLIVKPVVARTRAQKQIEHLERGIAELEQLERRGPLDGVPPAARYQAAATLAEATLLARAAEAPANREQLVQKYFARMEEEYSMAKPTLQQTTATRAEVVALGLALKEVALSLDGEIATFRAQAARLVDEARLKVVALQGEAVRAAAAEAGRKLDEGRRSLAVAAEDEARQAVERIAGQLEQQVGAAEEKIAATVEERLASGIAEQRREIEALAARAREEISGVVAEQRSRIDSLAAELEAQSSAESSVRAEIARSAASLETTFGGKLRDVRDQLDAVRASQKAGMGEIHKQLDRTSAELSETVRQESGLLSARIGVVEEEQRQQGARISSLTAASDAHRKSLDDTHEEVKSRIASTAAALESRIDAGHQLLHDQLQAARAHHAQQVGELREQFTQASAELAERMRQESGLLSGRIGAVEAGQRQQDARIETLTSAADAQRKSLADTAAALRSQITTTAGALEHKVDRGFEQLHAQLQAARSHHTQQMDELRQQLSAIREDFAEADQRLRTSILWVLAATILAILVAIAALLT